MWYYWYYYILGQTSQPSQPSADGRSHFSNPPPGFPESALPVHPQHPLPVQPQPPVQQVPLRPHDVINSVSSGSFNFLQVCIIHCCWQHCFPVLLVKLIPLVLICVAGF